MKILKKHGRVIIGILVAIQLVVLFFGLGPFEGLNFTEGALSHRSQIWISEGGNLEIKESIKVRVAGKWIKFGIARALPKEYKNSLGHPSPLEHQVLSAEKNGKPIEYISSKKPWGTRIQLWKEDKPLPHGDYEYTFHYRVFGQSKILPIGEEIKRYLTGKWRYPVLEMEASLYLPKSIDPRRIKFRAYIQREVYEQDKDGNVKLVETKKLTEDIRVSRPNPYEIHLEATRALYPGEEVIFDLLFP